MASSIELTQGKLAIVDDEDFESVNQFKWYAIRGKTTYYAQRSIQRKGKRSSIYMHRLILDTPFDMDSHHINGNGLDNRRCNLRVCSRLQHGNLWPRIKSQWQKNQAYNRQLARFLDQVTLLLQREMCPKDNAMWRTIKTLLENRIAE